MRVLMLFTMGFTFWLGSVLANFSVLFSSVLLLLAVALFHGLSMPYFGKSVVLFLIGAFCAMVHLEVYTASEHIPLEKYDGETIFVEALVLEYPEMGLYNYSIMTEVSLPSGVKGKTLVYGGEAIASLSPGDSFQGDMEISLANSTYAGIDISYYYERGILMRGKISGDVEVFHKESIFLRHVPVYLAEGLKKGIAASFSEEHQGLIVALVTGNKDGLSDSFYSALTRSGLSHIVAVSGMHLSFFAMMFRYCFPAGKTWVTLLFIAVMLLFMLVSGSTPSIIRATVMLVLMAIAPLLGRGRDDATALSTAVLFILLWNPYTVTHVGLLLSVASVTSIFTFSNRICRWMQGSMEGFCEFGLDPEKKHKLWKKVYYLFLNTVSVSLGAMIFTTPLVAWFFGNISLITPVANILCLLPVTICFMFGFVAAVVGAFVPLFGVLIGIPATLAAYYLHFVIPILGRIPFAAVTTDSVYYTLWLCFIYVMVGGYLLWFRHFSVIYPVVGWIFAFILAFFFHTGSVYTEGIVAQVLDVGQGQAAVFYMGKVLVVADCGGNSYDNAGDLVADRVNMLGRSTLDLLFLSHCDADHANGVIQLMDRLFVKRIAMPPLEEGHELQNAIVEKARDSGTEILFIEEYLEFSIEEVYSVRIYPPVGEKSINERGICLLLSVGEEDILLTGDIGSGTEENLIATFDIPDIEVLFVGHHGSRFSSSAVFLDTVKPERAVISVSGTNSYGHPTQEVLDKLEEREILVMRTDEIGVVEFSVGIG